MSDYLIVAIHRVHVQKAIFEPACLLCLEAAEKRPSWVRRLPLIAKELGTRGSVA